MQKGTHEIHLKNVKVHQHYNRKCHWQHSFSFMLLWKCFYITISGYFKQIVIRVYYNDSPYHQCVHLNLYVSVPSAEE